MLNREKYFLNKVNQWNKDQMIWDDLISLVCVWQQDNGISLVLYVKLNEFSLDIAIVVNIRAWNCI